MDKTLGAFDIELLSFELMNWSADTVAHFLKKINL